MTVCEKYAVTVAESWRTVLTRVCSRARGSEGLCLVRLALGAVCISMLTVLMLAKFTMLVYFVSMLAN